MTKHGIAPLEYLHRYYTLETGSSPVVLGGSCPWLQLSLVAIVLGGSCPDGNCLGRSCGGSTYPDSCSPRIFALMAQTALSAIINGLCLFFEGPCSNFALFS